MRIRLLSLGLSLGLSPGLIAAAPTAAAIPATPVMTLYRFNGPTDLPYYEVETFVRKGASSPAGTLAQGTSVIPCLVVRDGQPLTDGAGTPYVGFRVVVDARKATPADPERFRQAVAERRSLTVASHHCERGVKHVIDVRNLYAMDKAPFFDPPGAGEGQKAGDRLRRTDSDAGCPGGGCEGRPGPVGGLDAVVRAFHASPECAEANRTLLGRREALDRAWDRFTRASEGRWPDEALRRARHLDYTLRTALFEGHLDRGCNAYGACERNVIALSIRNRGRESCLARQGCGAPGDFQGVASAVSQYNIWDEYLTQVSGLTSCFLRPELGESRAGGGDGSRAGYYARLQRMYAQGVGDIERVLFGDDADLQAAFPGTPLADLKALRHYYHAPAMGKCFPGHERVEYIAGAVAARGGDFALIANARVEVGERTNGGYLFREVTVREEPDRDVLETADRYPGFVLDGRKVTLKRPTGCAPYGIPAGCRLERVGRYRKTPSWLASGRPIEVQCRVLDRGEQCQAEETPRRVGVGGRCDKEMRPVAGVP
jgi:hypothetical protein